MVQVGVARKKQVVERYHLVSLRLFSLGLLQFSVFILPHLSALQRPAPIPLPNHIHHPLPLLHRRKRQQVQRGLILVREPPDVVLQPQNGPLERPQRRRVPGGVLHEAGAVRLLLGVGGFGGTCMCWRDVWGGIPIRDGTVYMCEKAGTLWIVDGPLSRPPGSVYVFVYMCVVSTWRSASAQCRRKARCGDWPSRLARSCSSLSVCRGEHVHVWMRGSTDRRWAQKPRSCMMCPQP